MGKIIHNEAAPGYITNPINLDAAIQELQKAIADNVDWIKCAYARARVIPEVLNGKTLYLPKVYYASGEYQNVLTNDNFSASSWFQTTGNEYPIDYLASNEIQKYQCYVSLIAWFNLADVLPQPGEDYIHSEYPKRDLVNIIGRYPNVQIVKIYDENAKDIFREYTMEVEKDQFLTHPKQAIRIDFLLSYDYDSACI
jgi:hypothetical protein